MRLEPHRSLAQVTVASLSASVAKSMVYILAEAAPSVLAPPPLRPFFFNGMLSRKRRLQLQLQPTHKTTHTPKFVYSTRTCDSPTLSMPGLDLPFRQPRKQAEPAQHSKQNKPLRGVRTRGRRGTASTRTSTCSKARAQVALLLCAERKEQLSKQKTEQTMERASREMMCAGVGNVGGDALIPIQLAMCSHPLFAQNAFLFPACSCTMREPSQNSPEDTLG